MSQPTATMPASKLRLPCPECQQRALVRSSRPMSDVSRHGVLECTDIENCGWRGRFIIEVVNTIVPSQSPRPDLHLPLSPRSSCR